MSDLLDALYVQFENAKGRYEQAITEAESKRLDKERARAQWLARKAHEERERGMSV